MLIPLREDVPNVHSEVSMCKVSNDSAKEQYEELRQPCPAKLQKAYVTKWQLTSALINAKLPTYSFLHIHEGQYTPSVQPTVNTALLSMLLIPGRSERKSGAWLAVEWIQCHIRSQNSTKLHGILCCLSWNPVSSECPSSEVKMMCQT